MSLFKPRHFCHRESAKSCGLWPFQVPSRWLRNQVKSSCLEFFDQFQVACWLGDTFFFLPCHMVPWKGPMVTADGWHTLRTTAFRGHGSLRQQFPNLGSQTPGVPATFSVVLQGQIYFHNITKTWFAFLIFPVSQYNMKFSAVRLEIAQWIDVFYMTRERCYKTVHSKAQVLNRLIHVNASEYGKFTDRGSGSYGNCQLLIFGIVSRKEYPKLSEKAAILVFHFPTTYPCEKGFSMCFSQPQDITADWMQQIGGPSCLLFSQTAENIWPCTTVPVFLCHVFPFLEN